MKIKNSNGIEKFLLTIVFIQRWYKHKLNKNVNAEKGSKDKASRANASSGEDHNFILIVNSILNSE